MRTIAELEGDARNARASLRNLAGAAVDTTNRLKSMVRMTDQLSAMHAQLDDLNRRISLADQKNADLKDECNGSVSDDVEWDLGYGQN